MTHKKLMFRSAAREKVLRGATALADAVRVTLGPKSKSVLIGKKWGSPIVCNDGVTIAKEFDLEDPEENLGAQMIRQAAERTGDAVGDGTTTSTHPRARDLRRGRAKRRRGRQRDRSEARARPRARGRGRRRRASISRPVASRKEKVQIATISAHNDATIGELVGDAVERVGGEGVITVEEAKGTETAVEVVQGMQFDRGYLSPYFVTDPERMECVLEDAAHPPLRQAHRRHEGPAAAARAGREGGAPLLVVAEDVEGDALATLVVNKLRGTLAVRRREGAGLRRPPQGDARGHRDPHGRPVIAEELGLKLENVTARAARPRRARVVVKQDDTTIIGGGGDKRRHRRRASSSSARRSARRRATTTARSSQERLAKLAGGVAVIRVGAPSEAELKSQKEAFEDAISADQGRGRRGDRPRRRARAASRDRRARRRGGRSARATSGPACDPATRALEAPTRQIAENSGVDAGVVVERMRAGAGNCGFDAAQRARTSISSKPASSIPTKVVRIALENAVSVASVLLLTEATMTDVPEPHPHAGTDAEAALE